MVAHDNPDAVVVVGTCSALPDKIAEALGSLSPNCMMTRSPGRRRIDDKLEKPTLDEYSDETGSASGRARLRGS